LRDLEPATGGGSSTLAVPPKFVPLLAALLVATNHFLNTGESRAFRAGPVDLDDAEQFYNFIGQHPAIIDRVFVWEAAE
jgi:hypothetical protein